MYTPEERISKRLTSKIRYNSKPEAKELVARFCRIMKLKELINKHEKGLYVRPPKTNLQELKEELARLEEIKIPMWISKTSIVADSARHNPMTSITKNKILLFDLNYYYLSFTYKGQKWFKKL